MKSVKSFLYRLLEPSEPEDPWWEKAFDVFLLALILLSVGAVALSTVDGAAEEYGAYLRGLQLFATGFFTVEYALKVYSCTVDERYSRPVLGRLRFAVSPMAIVDVLAFAPFYVLAFLAPGSGVTGITLLFRMLRLLKLFHYSHSLAVFARVLREKANQLVAAFLATGVLLMFSSSLVYFAERGAQPDDFSSIPATMWWGIVTLTTVGYGDASPVTPMGQLFGAITAVVGIGIVALPSGVLASGFIEQFSAERQAEREAGSGDFCPNCGHPLR